MLESFCAVHSLKKEQVTFVFDGDKLLESHTPAQLDMENGNIIEAQVC
jgi:hypothetical protein